MQEGAIVKNRRETKVPRIPSRTLKGTDVSGGMRLQLKHATSNLFYLTYVVINIMKSTPIMIKTCP